MTVAERGGGELGERTGKRVFVSRRVSRSVSRMHTHTDNGAGLRVLSVDVKSEVAKHMYISIHKCTSIDDVSAWKLTAVANLGTIFYVGDTKSAKKLPANKTKSGFQLEDTVFS